MIFDDDPIGSVLLSTLFRDLHSIWGNRGGDVVLIQSVPSPFLLGASLTSAFCGA